LALSSDHDDDDRGASRRDAAGARQWSGQRAAATDGDRDHRRSAVVAISDAVHDAGRISRLGQGQRLDHLAAVAQRLCPAAAAVISAPFIRRPIATSLLMAAVLIAGFAAFRQLGIAALRPIELPTIWVLAA